MISYRPAAPFDAVALTALVLASHAYADRYRAIIESYPVTAELIASGISRMAEDACGLAGFYWLDVDKAELDLMFVADDRQGAGAGRRLFDDMVAQARAAGLPSVRIVAHPPTAGFYRRMGARDVGVVPPSGRIDWERPELRLDLT